MYVALLGRFVSRDPAEYDGSGGNLYRYAEARPVVLSDPSGKIPIRCECYNHWYSWSTTWIETDCGGLASSCCPNACGSGFYWTGEFTIIGAAPSVSICMVDAFCTGAGHGGMAFCDGFIPIWEPFAGCYDPDDPSLRISRCCGVISRDALILACASGGGVRGWIDYCRHPRLYERGCTTVPRSVWQQIRHLDPCAKGRWLTNRGFGNLAGFSCPSQFGHTIFTGPTPGAAVALIGIAHSGEALVAP